jgi:hypothetical protein
METADRTIISGPSPKNGDPTERRADRDVCFHRRTLHHTDAVLVQDLALPFQQALGHDCSPDDRFAFPHFGAFRWRLGSFERLIDPNTVLKVNGGEEFFESHLRSCRF